MDKAKPQHPMDLPAEQAAKLVRRMVPEIADDGTLTGEEVGVELGADEVLANRVQDGVITVVTVYGQKLTGKVPAGKAAK